MFRTIDDRVSVFSQLSPADMATARAQGFTTVINNRPDCEEPGQPSGDEIAAAASDAGLGYVAIPVLLNDIGEDQVAQMADALEQAPGRVLAFCRSGTRSTYLWALARARLGDDGEALIAKAANAGYDLSPLRGVIA